MDNNNESFYGDRLMDWLREVCIVETEDEVYYDAESADEEEIELFINNLKAQNMEEENEKLEQLSFKTAEDFIAYLDDDADNLLRIKNNILKGTYSFFSLHGHPSYVSIFQFRDAFKNDNRADTSIMAPHATQCVLAFMSIFIVDFMKLAPEIKTMYDKLEEPRRFAIGMYEDAMRGEKKFQ